MYDFEIERAVGEVERRRAKKVFVQAPDGLKQFLADFVSRLSKVCEVYVSINPCYGGCDLEDDKAAMIGADMVIHIGHEKFIEGAEKVQTIYLPAPHMVDVKDLASLAASELKKRGFTKVGVLANLQHVVHVGEFVRALEAAGIMPVVDRQTAGLVLGCRTGGAKRIEGEVDAFLFIGGGEFHPLGVAMDVEKEVFIADPYRNEVRGTVEMVKKTLSQRWWAIMEAAKSKRFGVIVVTKPGQFSIKSAEKIAAGIRAAGREAYQLVGDEVSPERFASFPFIEAFIVTGCPRIATDAYQDPNRPVLNEAEAWKMLEIIKPGNR
ncbi:MAG: diphthamide biosynthesis enzyme Dph2 [Candidatus Methanosuratincola verstraetei]